MFLWRRQLDDLGNGISVEILEVPFNTKKHQITECLGYKGSVCLINNTIPFGIDGNLPKMELRYIKIKIKDKTYQLETSNMYDAWGSRPIKHESGIEYFSVVCTDSESCDARGTFSDGAGSFVGEWQIRFGVVQRTVLSNQKDIVNLFLNSSAPPTYD